MPVTITVELTEEQAEAYAQFLKRVCYGDYRLHSVDQEEAYTAQSAGEKIRQALADAGFNPR